MTELTPALVRAARELLGWSAERLAHEAAISISTLNRYQYARNTDDLGISLKNVVRVRRALEAAGAQFQNDDAGIGVRLRSQDGAQQPPR